MFRGAYTALITPLRHDRLDEPALVRLVEQQLSAGIDGLVPCGTTGEASTLSMSEHLRVVELTVQTAAGRVPVLAGAAANDTRKAVELARACKQLGASGTLQVTPYYNKPAQDGLDPFTDLYQYTPATDTLRRLTGLKDVQTVSNFGR